MFQIVIIIRHVIMMKEGQPVMNMVVVDCIVS